MSEDDKAEVDDRWEKYSTLCMSHDAEWHKDCEYCVESADLCRDLHHEVVQQVNYFEHEMMQQGAMVDQGAFLGIKVDILISMMLTNKGRAYFEYLFQSRMAAEYKNLLGQLARMKLTQGTGQVPDQNLINKLKGGKG